MRGKSHEVVVYRFAQLILYSNAISLAGPYATFFELGQGVLKMLADIHRVSVKPSDVEELGHRFATLPAHPDVEQGLTQLKAAGFRLVAFTNSPSVHPSPAENAGLSAPDRVLITCASAPRRRSRCRSSARHFHCPLLERCRRSGPPAALR
jgi:FMN phosphatase YigB (HAD superfamily)